MSRSISARRLLPFFVVLVLFTVVVEGVQEEPVRSSLALPWKEAGLTERQAAGHLLDRLAYGSRPGEIERLVEMGLDTWVERQLRADFKDVEIQRRLRDFKTLDLSARQVAATYPQPGQVLRMAQRAGVIDRRQAEEIQARRGEDSDRRPRGERRQVMEFARDQGFRPIQELVGELMVQKLLRAVYAENQLHEVLTDFWFNHFNVSLTDNECRVFVSAYERDAIRPFVLDEFRAMLEATAKHPAMLFYLDNARSVAPEGTRTTFARDVAERRVRRGSRGEGRRRAPRGGEMDGEVRRLLEDRRPQGLNENYARELMELHTLGVDGGYTQDDVVEVARAFTGWATYPLGPAQREIEARIARARRFPQAGFVFEDSFIFRADVHDAESKTVLGRRLVPGRGIEDGLEVLDLLATHPSTAQHLARKLAVRFVSDEPPASLVDRLAKDFLESRGDLGLVMRTLVQSPEFWSAEARGSKIKSPFELVASSLRALEVRIVHPRPIVEWIGRMGQPLYAYQAPTGYPDRADAWVNTGSLLHRMNFGLELATGRIGGLRFDVAALNHHREPESLDDALATYVPILLPERDSEQALRRLEPVVRDPELAQKLSQVAPLAAEGSYGAFDEWGEWDEWDMGAFPGGDRGRDRWPVPPGEVDNSPLAHVVGVILGSPEFQRR